MAGRGDRRGVGGVRRGDTKKLCPLGCSEEVPVGRGGLARATRKIHIAQYHTVKGWVMRCPGCGLETVPHDRESTREHEVRCGETMRKVGLPYTRLLECGDCLYWTSSPRGGVLSIWLWEGDLGSTLERTERRMCGGGRAKFEDSGRIKVTGRAG
jgi:ribosomal protein S27E